MSKFSFFSTVAGGLGIGAALMYLLDPERGTQRRALLGDNAHWLLNKIPLNTHSELIPPGDQIKPLSLFSNDVPTDQVLEARVRSKIERIITRPELLNIKAINGLVFLEGEVLRHEMNALMSCVENVLGVETAVSRLKQIDQNNDPSQIIDSEVTRTVFENEKFTDENTHRILGGIVGTAALACGAFKRDRAGIGLGLVGMALLARSAIDLGSFDKENAGNYKTLTFNKTFNFDLPADLLYELFTQIEGSIFRLSDGLTVTNLGNNIFQWKMEYSDNLILEWETEITCLIDNEMIVWRSLPNALFENNGYVLFEPTAKGETAATLRIQYALSGDKKHIEAAKLFGRRIGSISASGLFEMNQLLESETETHLTSQNQLQTIEAYQLV